MAYYDPDRAPDPRDWLAMNEQERIEAAETYHRIRGITVPNAHMHAVFHAVVENQLAEGIPEVEDALDRLVREGLDRHEALHAIGYALAQHLHGAMKSASPSDPNSAYLRALKNLTAAKWKRGR